MEMRCRSRRCNVFAVCDKRGESSGRPHTHHHHLVTGAHAHLSMAWWLAERLSQRRAGRPPQLHDICSTACTSSCGRACTMLAARCEDGQRRRSRPRRCSRGCRRGRRPQPPRQAAARARCVIKKRKVWSSSGAPGCRHSRLLPLHED